MKEILVVNIEKKPEEVNSEKDQTDKSLRIATMHMKETQGRYEKTNIKIVVILKVIEATSQYIKIKGRISRMGAKK